MSFEKIDMTLEEIQTENIRQLMDLKLELSRLKQLLTLVKYDLNYLWMPRDNVIYLDSHTRDSDTEDNKKIREVRLKQQKDELEQSIVYLTHVMRHIELNPLGELTQSDRSQRDNRFTFFNEQASQLISISEAKEFNDKNDGSQLNQHDVMSVANNQNTL